LGQAPVAGKTILLYHEQGMGDTIQFARYSEALSKEGAHVIIQVQAPLVPLMRGMAGTERVIGPKDPLPPFQLQCPLMSLPLAFGARLENIPAKVPYLSVPSEWIAAWTERLGTAAAPRVGIAWSGNPKHGNDQNRSIALKELLPLLSAGVEVVSLQKDVSEADRDVLKAHPQIQDFGAAIRDFADTAALMSLLDLVISVDTAPVHLAGALGKPVWVLLPFSPDWRWMLDREDSPWYPTARLFRQPAFGDWHSVIRRIAEELRRRFASSVTDHSRVPS
jgi:ADP-heptose:LPS heptosyltransferase